MLKFIEKDCKILQLRHLPPLFCSNHICRLILRTPYGNYICRRSSAFIFCIEKIIIQQGNIAKNVLQLFSEIFFEGLTMSNFESLAKNDILDIKILQKIYFDKN